MKKLSYSTRLVALTVVSLCLLSLLAGCMPISPAAVAPKEQAASTAPTVRLCYTNASATNMLVLYAYEKGFFAKYGVTVTPLYIKGAANAVKALIAGEVDFCQVAGTAVINAAVAGEDTVFIAGLYNAQLYSLMVQPEIADVADLKGKVLAINDLGGAADRLTRSMLMYLHLTPDKDVAILAVGEQAERIKVMAAGQVAGTLVTIPETIAARKQGFRELLDLSTLNMPYQYISIATTKHMIKANRPVAIKLMQGMIAAITHLPQDRAGYIEVLAKYMKLDATENADLMNAAYENLVLKNLQMTPYPTLEGIQSELDGLALENPQAAKLAATDLVDSTIVQEIEQSDFIKGLSK